MIHESYTNLPHLLYPIHGVYKEWDQSGVLMTEANFQNGKKHGVYKVFFNPGMKEIFGKENVGSCTPYLTIPTTNSMDWSRCMTTRMVSLKSFATNLANGTKTKEETWYKMGKPESLSTLMG